MRIKVPALDIDTTRCLSPNEVLERRIVAHLFNHLKKAGWLPYAVDSGEDLEEASTVKGVMELIFNLDDCLVCVRKALPRGGNKRYESTWFELVLGNSESIISDWSTAYKTFDIAMDTFKVEEAF